MGPLSPSVVIEFIQAEQLRLESLVKPAVDAFWAEHRRQAVGGGTGTGRYGVSLRRRAAGLSIQWFEIRYVTTKEGRRRLPKHVTLAKGRFCYEERDFPRAKEWELAHIAVIERLAEPIRRLTPLLGNLQKQVKLYARTAGLEMANVPEPDVDGIEAIRLPEDLNDDPTLPPDLADLLR